MAVSAPSVTSRRGRRADQLTGGRHGLSADEVRASQRKRIMRAMTETVGEHGYHGVRVADVVWRAGVSRKTFYELFDGKQGCFAATYELWIANFLRTTFDAYETENAWVDRLRAGLAALLDALQREPDAARLCFCEVVAADGETQQLREQTIEDMARLFDAPEPRDGALGATLRAGRVSELTETLRREIAEGRTAHLPDLAPGLMCAMVLPFLGMDAAQRELTRGAMPAG